MTYERPSDRFFKERLERLLGRGSSLLDIGGGLRIDPERSNRLDPQQAWIRRRIEERGITYRVLDYVDTYHPDIVGDIQNLPLPDNSEDAIACLSVLEHVENPFRAVEELRRVLRPQGAVLVYVPFLFYYHAERGYYKDYWRFTKDALTVLFAPFSEVEIHPTRGPFETLVRLTPLGRTPFPCFLGHLLDRLFGKLGSRQTSGYLVYAVK